MRGGVTQEKLVKFHIKVGILQMHPGGYQTQIPSACRRFQLLVIPQLARRPHHSFPGFIADAGHPPQRKRYSVDRYAGFFCNLF